MQYLYDPVGWWHVHMLPQEIMLHAVSNAEPIELQALFILSDIWVFRKRN